MKPPATCTVIRAHESSIACLTAHSSAHQSPHRTTSSLISADDGGILRRLPLSNKLDDDLKDNRSLLEPLGQAPGAVTALACHGRDVFCAVVDPISFESCIVRFSIGPTSPAMNQPPLATSVTLSNDEINHITLLPSLHVVLATGDCGTVFVLALDSLDLVGRWCAHEQMCVGVYLLDPLDNQQLQVARSPKRPLSIDLVTVSMGYSIKTWKVKLLGSKIVGQPSVSSDLDLSLLLPSLRGTPASGTIYNPPIICSYLSTTSHACHFSSPPVHIFGLGSGAILVLRQRPSRASSKCTDTFPWPHQGNRTGPWRGWEGLELQTGGHGYFVEQLAFVQGSQGERLMVSGCTDGSISVWDMNQLFVTGQPAFSVASVGVKVSALAAAIADARLIIVLAGPFNKSSAPHDEDFEVASTNGSLIVRVSPL